jgi:hypothetical protein
MRRIRGEIGETAMVPPVGGSGVRLLYSLSTAYQLAVSPFPQKLPLPLELVKRT